MAKQLTEAEINREIKSNNDADTLIAAKRIQADKNAHVNAIKIIETRQQISTLVLEDK